MTSPLISVLLPVRDGQRFIKEALDSILADRVAETEVIVIDDGSIDATVAAAQSHPLLPTIHRQARLGLPFALNQALALATGQYLAFIDADDVWPLGRTNRLLVELQEDLSKAGVFGTLSNTDAELGIRQEPMAARLITTGMFRRFEFETVGRFRTDVVHAAGIDWISRADAAELRFGNIADLVLLRRIHGQNMGIVDKERGRRDMLVVMRDHHRRSVAR